MTPLERHARLDEATVYACEATTWRDERDYLLDCRRCAAPFWVHPDGAARRYCSETCQHAAMRLRNHAIVRAGEIRRRARAKEAA